MQGQRSIFNPYPGAVNLNEESTPDNAGVDHPSAWNNMLNPVESHLPNHALSSSNNARSYSGWDMGESSSSATLQNQDASECLKFEYGWPPLSDRFGPDSRSSERQYGPSNILNHDIFHSSPGGNQVMQSSGSSCVPMSINQSAGYVGNNDAGDPCLGVSDTLNSGDSGYLAENEVGSGSSLGTWGSSCKRKNLEGTSGHSFPGSSSTCFSHREDIVRQTVPVRYNASTSLSINPHTANRPEPPYPRMGGFGFPPSGPETTESSTRIFGVPIPPHVVAAARCSNVCSSQQSSQSISLHDFLDSTNPPNPSHLMYVPSLLRSTPPLPWNSNMNRRAGSSSSSFAISGERGAELNFRSTLRNNVQDPNFVPSSETRNSVQDPTSWSLVTGNANTNPDVPSSSRNSNGSGSRVFSNTWIPHNISTPHQQRLPEFSPWTLFSSSEAEPGVPRGHFTPFPSGSSSSSEETPNPSSGPNGQGHRNPHPRSVPFVEFMDDDWHSIAADIEDRQRMVSEIRQVLNAMRRGENIRAQDLMLIDPFLNGFAELHDRHREMRLDVDNMSYEELLALEERIGNVNTGLGEDTIMKSLKQRKHTSFSLISPKIIEPCCICQEDYVSGDDLGILDCGHEFHTECVKQWLMQKNLCPICKNTALPT